LVYGVPWKPVSLKRRSSALRPLPAASAVSFFLFTISAFLSKINVSSHYSVLNVRAKSLPMNSSKAVRKGRAMNIIATNWPNIQAFSSKSIVIIKPEYGLISQLFIKL
jgi:hypothetical protein